MKGTHVKGDTIQRSRIWAGRTRGAAVKVLFKVRTLRSFTIGEFSSIPETLLRSIFNNNLRPINVLSCSLSLALSLSLSLSLPKLTIFRSFFELKQHREQVPRSRRRPPNGNEPPASEERGTNSTMTRRKKATRGVGKMM